VTLTKVQKYPIVTLFNSLPPCVKRLAGDTNTFKQALKKYLMENSFYSVEEYIVNDTR